MLLVQHAVPAEARDGAKGRTAMNAESLGRFQQPLVEQDPVVLAVLVDVEAQKRPLHGSPQQ